MSLSGPLRQDSAGSGDPDAANLLRSVRDRLEAIVFGLRELEYLRERQEAVVRAALEKAENEENEPRMLAHRSSPENILVLRKQLSYLGKDAALITQLQELDQQISDLRLDAEASHDQLEIYSRPSSGFYELSDVTSGSLSNSSNSVFSESFCPVADAGGNFLSTDELVNCLDSGVLVGGICDDLSPFAAVRRSLSVPPPPPMDGASLVVSDFQSKSPIDLLARNIYCYLGPLCPMAIQCSAFLQTFSPGVGGRDEADTESLKPEPSVPSDPFSDLQNFPFQKNMDSYIYNLLQRRAQPIRTNRPRTTISTDPSKSFQQQASLCVRQAFGPSSGFRSRGYEIKPCQPTEEQEVYIKTGLNIHCSSSPGIYRTLVSTRDVYRTVKVLTRKRSTHSAGSVAAPQEDLQEYGPATLHATPKDVSSCPPNQELRLKSLASVRTSPDPPKNHSDPVQSGTAESGERSSWVGEGRGAEIRRSCRNGPSKQKSVKLHWGSSKSIKNSTKKLLVSENNKLLLERRPEKKHHRSSSRKFQVMEGGASTRIKVLKRRKFASASVLECQLPDRNTTPTLGTFQSDVFRQHHHGNLHHHHHHGRVVVSNPKSKHSDHRWSQSIKEVPSDGAVRRALRQQRKEVLRSSGSNVHPSSRRQRGSYGAGSDSEYSAECMSLFHSTIVETSEDEKSNYTTNCFGDGESSEEEKTEESSIPSSTEDSVRAGAGGRGRGWRLAGSNGIKMGRQDMRPAQRGACVKIKASYKLKKKILRFKSGSLKLMTTV